MTFYVNLRNERCLEPELCITVRCKKTAVIFFLVSSKEKYTVQGVKD